MNIFEGVKIALPSLVGPIIILILTMTLTVVIYRLLFRWLPSKIFNFFIGPIALFGAYIWAVPMNMGFYEYFN
jgi:hypothetical protein